MVAFFNKKEDVIDLQLTGYGKLLLAQGTFKPSYYAFFDDDILYDSECGGFAEIQNNAEVRIQEETPSCKVVANIVGAETRVNAFVEGVASNLNIINTVPSDDPNIAFAFNQQQLFEEKVDLLYDPLGNSALSSDKAPAWKVTALHNEIDSTTVTTLSTAGRLPDHSGRGIVQNIPQINIEIDYETFFSEGPPTVATVSPLLNDTLYLSVNRDYLVIEVLEENTDFLKENFDIEVFYSGTLATTLTPPTSENIQMSFMEAYSEAFPQPVTAEVQTPNVEYYMDVLLDDELPSGVVNELNLPNTRTSSGRLRLNMNLYKTPDEGCC
jgi:hypothetical protein